jgi:hypothetical protein
MKKQISEKELEEIVEDAMQQFDAFKDQLCEKLNNSFVGEKPISFLTTLAIQLPHKEAVRQSTSFDCDDTFCDMVSEKVKERYLIRLKDWIKEKLDHV